MHFDFKTFTSKIKYSFRFTVAVCQVPQEFVVAQPSALKLSGAEGRGKHCKQIVLKSRTFQKKNSSLVGPHKNPFLKNGRKQKKPSQLLLDPTFLWRVGVFLSNIWFLGSSALSLRRVSLTFVWLAALTRTRLFLLHELLGFPFCS